MKNYEAAAVRFQDGSVVEVDDVFSHCDQYQGAWGYLSPTHVIWEDGSESYGKGWWLDGKLCRVGAGAYGDKVVLDRQLELWANRKVETR